jgi:hypothetical protein
MATTRGTKKSSTDERWRSVSRTKVEAAMRAAGFDEPKAFFVAHSRETLSEMARKLGITAHAMIVYHTAWQHERRESGEVAPLRLLDEEK